jgi:hypothetical protein
VFPLRAERCVSQLRRARFPAQGFLKNQEFRKVFRSGTRLAWRARTVSARSVERLGLGGEIPSRGAHQDGARLLGHATATMTLDNYGHL